jgi:phosphoribosylglycinamide formyltransferase-1
MERRKVISFLVSGRGSNFYAIAKKIQEGYIKADFGVLISSNSKAKAIELAKEFPIKVYVVDYKKYSSRREAEKEIERLLDEVNTDLIVCAGFMKVLTPDFVNKYRYRIMNIHPSLLPSFPGVNAHRQAIEYGVEISGCTVHFIDEGVDTGPIILQKAVRVYDDDDEESLADRVLKWEHKAYPEAVRLFVEDRLKIEGRKVYIRGEVNI